MSVNADESGSTGTLSEVAACQDWICRAESLIYLSKSLFMGLTVVQKTLKKRVWGQELRGMNTGAAAPELCHQFCSCLYSISKPGTTRAHGA